MSTTLEFYPIFRDAMAGRGIRFAATPALLADLTPPLEDLLP